MNYHEIFQVYDPEYTYKVVETKGKRIKKYFTQGVEIEGLKNLERTHRKQTIYVSNHKSQLDGLMIGKLIFENRTPEDFAHILSTTNMNLTFFKMIGYDLSRLNFCWIDPRGVNDQDYQKRWSSEVQKRLAEKKSFLVFPEGTRSQNTKIAIEKIKNGFLREVVHSGQNPYISPIAIDYDYVYETPFFPIQNFGKRHFSPLYYLGCALPVITHPFSKRRHGKVYIHFAEPRRLTEIITDEVNRLGVLKRYLGREITREYEKIKLKKEEKWMN